MALYENIITISGNNLFDQSSAETSMFYMSDGNEFTIQQGTIINNTLCSIACKNYKYIKIFIRHLLLWKK